MIDLNDLPGWNVGDAQISVASPAGGNPRSGEDFEAVEEQLNRLVEIHDHQPVDWSLVSSLSEKILTEQGKDLSVAVWFLVARMHVQNTTGLAVGVHVLKEVVCLYWQDMTPPLRRLRARRNIIYWLFDQIKAFVEKDTEAIDSSLYQQLNDDWLALDTFWQENDEDDAPPFYGLKRALAALPFIEEPEAPEEPAIATELEESTLGDNDDVSESTEDVAEANKKDDVFGKKSGELQKGTPDKQKNDTEDKKQSESSGYKKTSLPVPSFSSDNFQDSPVAAIDKALDSFSELIYLGFSNPSPSVLFYRLNRLCAWATVESVPFNDGGQSRIPAPNGQIMASCNSICEKGDSDSIVQFAETNLYNHRFWLDLNRLSYNALLSSNQLDTAELIKCEVSYLISRLPDLVNITFSNGQCFADEETKEWIAGMSFDKVVSTGATTNILAVENDVDQLIYNVVLETNKANLAKGLKKLQCAVEHTSSLQERFKIEVAQLQILVENNCSVDSDFFIKPLLETMEKYRLVDWNPVIAVTFLENGIKLLELDSKAKSSTKKILFSHLASVSMSDCWKLLSKS